MSEKSGVVIIGAGHAGVSLAFQLRRDGYEGVIRLVSEEESLPYHRPPLSKELLAGKKQAGEILLRPEAAYEQSQVTLIKGKAISINRTDNSVTLDSGEVLDYEFLVLCTGGRERRFPGAEQVQNCFYIRQLHQLADIRNRIGESSNVVIIGGGYIGLEAAAVLRQLGLGVTVLEAEDRILARVTGQEMSDYLYGLHNTHGVVIQTSKRVSELAAIDNKCQVSCEDGSAYEGDFVLVGIGVIPNTELAATSGIDVGNGILVDSECRTSDPKIFAAGDCSTFESALYARRLRLESVQNANDQARAISAAVTGKPANYDPVPWFWSDQYDVKLQMAGLNDAYDRVVVRGDWQKAAEKGFAVFYLKDSRLVAADCVSRPKEYMLSRNAIKAGLCPDVDALADESAEIAEVLALSG